VETTLGQALARKIPIVPVLIGGIAMPEVSAFPQGLVELADRHAVALREAFWKEDIDRIVSSLQRLTIVDEVPTTESASAVFLAFTGAGRVTALPLRERLEARGVAVWDAETNLRGGEIFADTIQAAIGRCRAVIVVITEDAGRSEWVGRELEWANAMNLEIVSIIIGQTEPSGSVARLIRGQQSLSVPDRYTGEDLDAIADGIALRLNRSAVTEESPPSLLDDSVAVELEALLGENGQLLHVSLEDFERRRHVVLQRLQETPLPVATFANYLRSDAPVRRLLAYCELQVHPIASQLDALLDTWSREAKHARESGETRGLWNLLQALHQYRHQGTIPAAVVKNVLRAAAEILEFLEKNDDLDPGRQCRISVQRLMELLVPPSV
jgi:hypothetical protein